MKLFYLVRDSVELSFLMLIYLVFQVLSYYRFIRRDHDYVHVVDVPELVFLSLRSTCHSSELLVHTEVVLDGDRSKSL